MGIGVIVEVWWSNEVFEGKFIGYSEYGIDFFGVFVFKGYEGIKFL